MGKKGIPMTVVMNGAGGSLVYNQPTENQDSSTQSFGSFFYDEDGVLTNKVTGSKYTPSENA